MKLGTRRVTFVTGKGGTGKTVAAVALAKALARRGRRVLLLEVDAPRSALSTWFGKAITPTPMRLAPRIDGANIDFMSCLAAYVESVVPVGRLVSVIFHNKVVQTFLTATPGARELVLLSRIRETSLDDRWDHVIVDLPASGHAMALFRTPGLAQRAFARGPLRRRADEIVERFTDTTVAEVLLCAIPGEMPVNETLETVRGLRALKVPVAGVLMNRLPDETLTPVETALLVRLSRASTEAPARAQAAVRALGEVATGQAAAQDGLARLEAELPGAVLRVPDVGGTATQVAEAISLILAGDVP